MRTRSAVNVTREVEAIFLDGMLGTWSDDRLLDRFAGEAGARAERAFTAIVERHGPRVYRVCRGIAGDGPTAEDAFQATFLVLARKAGTLRVHESLGPWLHGVAARLAASARASQACRTRHEAAAAHREEPATTDPIRDPDLARILHAEIGRLPARYREAVYLCDVEGLSQEIAAVRLSCAIGTIRSRLCRGRKRLRSRLIRRGIMPAALAAGMVSHASAALPLRLADAAVRNAIAITSGGASRGLVPAAAVALFEEGMTTMLKLKIRALIGSTILGLSATAAVVFAQDSRSGTRAFPEDPARKQSADAPRPEAGAAEQPPAENTVQDPFAEEGVRSLSRTKDGNQDATDPIKAFDPVIALLDARPQAPGEKEVHEALLRQRFPDLRFRIEKVAEVVDPAKDYPVAGRCQLVHMHYKATICYTEAGGPVRGREEVLFLDRDYLRRAPAETSAKPATPFQGLSNPNGQSPRQSSNGDRQSETERRLDDVERKLDRILKALEKDAAPQPKGSNGWEKRATTKQSF